MITLEQAKHFCKSQALEFEQARVDSADFSCSFDLLRKQKEWEHLYTELNILEGYMKESDIND
jgi:hypothetical protein